MNNLQLAERVREKALKECNGNYEPNNLEQKIQNEVSKKKHPLLSWPLQNVKRKYPYEGKDKLKNSEWHAITRSSIKGLFKS